MAKTTRKPPIAASDDDVAIVEGTPTCEQMDGYADRYLRLRADMDAIGAGLRAACDAYDIPKIRGGIVKAAGTIAEALSVDGGEVAMIFPELLCEVMHHADKKWPHPLTASPKARIHSWRNEPARLGVQAHAAAILHHFNLAKPARDLAQRIGTALTKGGALNERKEAYTHRDIERWRKELSTGMPKRAVAGRPNFLDLRQIEQKKEAFERHAQYLTLTAPSIDSALEQLVKTCRESRPFLAR